MNCGLIIGPPGSLTSRKRHHTLLALDGKILTSPLEKGLLSKKKESFIDHIFNPMYVLTFLGKHPVSALMELAVKRRWGVPTFSEAFACGPRMMKQFIYKV